MKKLLVAIALLVALAAPAFAQTSPNLRQGQVLTPAQWNALFTAKQDWLGANPLLVTGGTLTGKLTTNASALGSAGFALPPGTAPTSPINGDVWTTTAGMFVRINGATVGPLASVAGGPFTGQVLDSGATTTSPGYYVSITGDTVPRVRVGTNATDVASLAFGPGNANRDVFVERVGAGQLRFGAPDAASPVAQISSVQNVVAGTANTAGANRTIAGSQGTGTGVGGAIIFQIAPAGGSGTSQNALVTAASIFGTGGVLLSSATGGDKGIGTLNATGLYINGTAVTAGGIIVGTSIVTGGPGILYNTSSGGTLTALSAVNSSVVSFTSGGVLQTSTTLPSGLAATNMSLTTPSIGVAAGTSLALGGASIGGNTLAVTGPSSLNGITIISPGNVNALAVGIGGVSNPAFNVDTSTSLMATGINIKSAAAGGGIAVTVISSTTNEGSTWDAKGSGGFNINGTATGQVRLGQGGGGVLIGSALTYGGVTLSNAVSGTGNMALTAGTTFTGTTTIATLAATTINAFTLAGTISGGGNNLNNIIVGATTPLAGTFTTLTANTSVASPIHAGGTTASSTLTLESTTGAGTTDLINFKTASQSTRGTIDTSGNWAFGANIPITSLAPLLDLNRNSSAVAIPASPGITPLLRLIAADGTGGVTSIAMQVFGTSTQNALQSYMARGTSGSPTASQTGDVSFNFQSYLYNGSVYGNAGAASTSIQMRAAENLDSTHFGSTIVFAATASGNNSKADQMIIQNGVQIGPTLGTLSQSELGMNKITASGTAPGAGNGKLALVAGTNAGTCKLIISAGTSATAVTITDNVGAGC